MNEIVFDDDMKVLASLLQDVAAKKAGMDRELMLARAAERGLIEELSWRCLYDSHLKGHLVAVPGGEKFIVDTCRFDTATMRPVFSGRHINAKGKPAKMWVNSGILSSITDLGAWSDKP